MNKTTKAINDLEQFLDADLPTKIFPNVILKGGIWKRKDAFKNRKEVEDYIKLHFDILKKEIKK